MPVSNIDVICIPSDVLYLFRFSGNAKDSSGNGNYGVVTGNAKPTSDRFGTANEAFSFDGTTASISAPGSLLPIHAASRTLSFWVELLAPLTHSGFVNVWTFLAAVFSSDAPMSYTLYVNGQSLILQLPLPPDTQAGPLVMGSSGGNGSFLNGNLDSVRVYGRALTPSEIQGIYTGR